MSFSGVIYSNLMCASIVLLACGKIGWSFLTLACSFVFLAAAIYHDSEQERRIAKLEKELAKRGVDDG